MLDLNALKKKWQPFLGESKRYGVDAIKNDRMAAQTAILLENQLQSLQGTHSPDTEKAGRSLNKNLLESTAWGAGSTDPLGGGYYTQDVGGNAEFHKIAIPLVRRTFPELIAHDLVGVQPLTAPVGIAFALRFRAQQDYNGITTQYNQNPGNELGYNNMDPYYSGSGSLSSSFVTSAGEALGSQAGDGSVGSDIGLGIGSGTHIKEVGLTMEKEKVEAGTRKLRARWSLEIAQDLKAMHGVDIEKEMTDILSYEITAEIDRELIQAIRSVSNTTHSETVNWDDTTVFDGRWEHEKYRNLYNRIVRKANIIAITTRRGPGNFAVASPNVCAMLEATADYTIAPVNPNNVNTNSIGVSKVGTLGGRINLYRDTFAIKDDVVVGYKGPNVYDSGIIYLPYIQLMQSRAVFENSFNPAMGLMSRYAIMQHMFGADLYYIKIQINNLNY